MRRRALTALLLFYGTSVPAWTFTPLPVCTLAQPTDTGGVVVTFDPANGLYAITLTLTDGRWPQAENFAIVFSGNRSLRIGTDRHQISDDGTALTVQDTGFGNVLDGLQFNTTAQAETGGLSMAISLEDAAEPVAAFRACGSAAIS